MEEDNTPIHSSVTTRLIDFIVKNSTDVTRGDVVPKKCVPNQRGVSTT